MFLFLSLSLSQTSIDGNLDCNFVNFERNSLELQKNQCVRISSPFGVSFFSKVYTPNQIVIQFLSATQLIYFQKISRSNQKSERKNPDRKLNIDWENVSQKLSFKLNLGLNESK